ncbi:sigma-70 family RNA polymerase sigma factor [Psychroserpens damuponensis]|uniref:sigma-70 family RNA polymerase sigma factor n=1 Tax=Psychroserpens damuponensis TaxID=943936 RepID=UPI00058B6A3C|nr:sigma-70 family RNA polymerase sigma factor [Psychroserpens damuponensis]
MLKTKDIWELHSKDIKYFILSKVKNETVANDLLQDTFIKVHTKLETLKDINKLKSWLFTIARYTVYDYFKAHKIVDDKLDGIDPIADNERVSHDEKDCLHGIIKSLPKKYRDPLFLSDIKGIKQAEVAKQLELELPTAKSRIQRARKLIAQGYIDCCDFKINDDGYLVGEIKPKEECKICN